MNTNEHDRQARASAGPPTLAVVPDLLAVLVIERARQPHAIQHRRRALEHALQRVRKVVHVLMQFIKQEYIPPLAGRVIGPKRRRDSRKGSRKPSVPIEKLSTGGTAPTLNSRPTSSSTTPGTRRPSRSPGALEMATAMARRSEEPEYP